MDEALLQWNTHRIRPTKNQNVPNGRPDAMYRMPHLFDAFDNLCPITNDDFDKSMQYVNATKTNPDEIMFLVCDLIMNKYGWIKPSSVADMCELYSVMREEVLALLS